MSREEQRWTSNGEALILWHVGFTEENILTDFFYGAPPEGFQLYSVHKRKKRAEKGSVLSCH